MGDGTTEPAGERIVTDERPGVVDGAVSKLELRLLAVLAGGPGDGEVRSGAVVRRRLTDEYGSGVCESRVYQLLGDLVDRGLVEKERVVGGDARAKRFTITETGRETLHGEVAWLAARTPGISLDRPTPAEGTSEAVRSHGDD